MALSRVGSLKSIVRLPQAAAVSLRVLSDYGVPRGNNFVAERQNFERKEIGAPSWMSTHLDTLMITKPDLNFGTIGHVDNGATTFSSAATNNLHSNEVFPRSSALAGGRQTLFPFAAAAALNAAGKGGVQQTRTIMVEVRRNDLDRAIRRWRRKCKEENLKSLKDREYFKKPSEKKVIALKERDHRIMKRAFKQKLNWIMSRRLRGF